MNFGVPGNAAPKRLPGGTARRKFSKVRLQKPAADTRRHPWMRLQTGCQASQVTRPTSPTGAPHDAHSIQVDQVDGHVFVLLGGQEVGRLEVAVDDARRVHSPQQTTQVDGAARRQSEPLPGGILGQPPAEQVQVFTAGNPLGRQVTGAEEAVVAGLAGCQRPGRCDAAGQQRAAQLPTAARPAAAKLPAERFPPRPRAELLVGHVDGPVRQRQLGLDQQGLVADFDGPVEVAPDERVGTVPRDGSIPAAAAGPRHRPFPRQSARR